MVLRPVSKQKETTIQSQGETYFLSKSSVMAKFCHTSLRIGVDQICLLVRSRSFQVSLGRSWPIMVPASKLNWLLE